MSIALYYDDPFLRTFEATVTARRGDEVALDRTAFYPTGGGQPCDTGTLNGIPVLAVERDDEGRIWHRLAAPLEADRVRGEIDWAHRFDHMQQHTGQHLLSAVFHHLLHGETVGFHLGERIVTIDLDLPRLTREAAMRVEQEVNRLVWEDLPVEARFVSDEELARLKLRRAPKVAAPIRIVTIGDYDATPCGGTHLLRTGQIGLLKITAIERYKGGVRVTFLCGQRAMDDYRRLHETTRDIALRLTTAIDDLPAAVERLREENKALHREVRRLRLEAMEHEAPRLWESAPAIDGIKTIVGHRADSDLESLRRLAAILRTYPRTLILLATTEAKGCRYLAARSDDLPFDAAALLREALAPLGGRGGGSAQMAQGGGPPRDAATVEAALREAVRHHLDQASQHKEEA